ncbi:pilus assembly protein [Comamonas odontotermitis]|uniref:pilus assembly protein n=1 Tax=Comamonas odontotermitis TaxID=379895 RepID=UPI00366E0DB2
MNQLDREEGSMACKAPHRFRKNLLTIAVIAAIAPHGALALDLASGPPGTKEPYVAPNVILSLDDSGSMGNAATVGTKAYTLKAALIDVFNDTSLLPDGKIRLAWQTMNSVPKVNGSQWLTTLGTGAASASTANTSANRNLMRPLEGGHRANFLTYMANFQASGGTPTHDMVQRADQYMRAGLNQNGPWATKPGQGSPEYLGCRRNYHILLTDGGWNGSERTTSPRNYDGAATTLPDGTVYGSNTANNRLYRDSESYTTIADWAMYSWGTKLQDPALLTGTVQPSVDYRKAPSDETFKNRVTGATATLDRFWNPRYDPATWPHMVTFTIGFGIDALPSVNYLSNGKNAAMTKPTSMLPYGFDGNLADYANGTYSWKAWGGQTSGPPGVGTADRGHDMWHAALNGRGSFYAVEKNEDLKKAFQAIIGTINTENSADLTSTAASGANASRFDVATFTGAYEPSNAWKGYVKAETVNKDGSTTEIWGKKNTSQLLDAVNPSSRLILSWSDQLALVDAAVAEKGGVAFKWSTSQTYLSTTQNAKIGLNTTSPLVTSGANILAYIRGERIYEAPDGGATSSMPFRKRQSIQGDIINSGVWYTGAPAGTYAQQGYSNFVRAQKSREPMIYVGGNDGMLHGFSAADGSEKIAYIPQGVIASLKDLTSPGYTHKYYVDGSPMTGDVELGGVVTGGAGSYYQPNWRTLLVGTLGAGGKGYFVLDVTNPVVGSSSSAPTFTEANASTLVKLDRTRGVADERNCTSLTSGSAEKAFCEKAADEDKDIGYITAKPVLDESDPMRTTQITRMNNGRWAVVLGNGYNSANQRPVLLVQYLDGKKELLRLVATGAITAPAPVGCTNFDADCYRTKDNGLSAPRLVDLNGDGRVDIAYAGDNNGNLWKFDLTSDDAGQWSVALGGTPLFTARGPASLGSSARNNPQPITVAPTARANDRKKCLEFVVVGGIKSCKSGKEEAVGGMMVSFGTGRNVTTSDPNSVEVQTLYSVLDNTRYQLRYSGNSSKKQLKVCDASACPTPAALGIGVVTAGLVKRSITAANISGTSATPGAGRVVEDEDLYETDDAYTKYWLKTKNGWYMDLPAVGERLLKSMEMYDNTNILMAYTQVPAKGSNVDVTKESCESTSVDTERQYRTMLNIMDGAKPSIQLVDAANNGSYKATDNDNASRVQVDKGPHSQIASSETIMLDISTCKNDKCLHDEAERILRMPEQSLRPSWRQLK